MVLGAFCVERVAELLLHARHAVALAAKGARFEADDGFGLILVGQFLLFGGVLAEGLFAPWSRTGIWTWPLLGGLVAAQALRYWAIASLGELWTIRVVTLPGAARVTSGPYRFVPHPNYVAVAAEVVLLPIAFMTHFTLVVAGAVTAVALARRIRREERALARTYGDDAKGSG